VRVELGESEPPGRTEDGDLTDMPGGRMIRKPDVVVSGF
jgi:hypothetical protein